MCGIIGFTGQREAKNILIDGLKSLEYRGYDSAGITLSGRDQFKTIKTVGKVSDLVTKVNEFSDLKQTSGIGHTRWATHGGVTDQNAHPHTHGRVTLIHNGIIENYHELEMELSSARKHPISQTDSEIVAMLIDSLYDGDAFHAIREAVKKLEGAYAFCILFSEEPGTIYCVRNASPLVACHVPEGSIVASDMVALIKFSKDYFVLPEHHIARLTKEDITIYNMDHEEVTPNLLHVNWDITAAQKNGYPHFMLKEIFEQPEAIRSTILPRITMDNLPDLSVDQIPNRIFEKVNRVIITACGTAMHAGLIGRALIEKLLRIPVVVEIASEFRYQEPIMDENTLVITISQSGETADTLASLRLAKEAGAVTLSIVNVKGSTIARESDYVLYTHAGPEIAVASTKAYTAQLSCLYLLSYHFAYLRRTITKEQCAEYIQELKSVIPAVEQTLQLDKKIDAIGKNLICKEDLFFIGRGLDYALCCEGSIKLKEISYIHSEAYAAGELKHGTLSLITEGVPVVALATQSKVYPKMISNIREVKARGAEVILITNERQEINREIYDYHIALPNTSDILAPFTAAIAMQLLSYYTSVHRGSNVDQPRNLAKAVTVE
ncbi:glutamine--fructose-6-phosphate transaminase (isomerizing) [Lachnospiraceae bacterium MD1]|uniref:Glutamine--fructose-6-phosphate aminotransferase [isomerizing] n=1 Tax=Variimorphobacter saccharofermentans TaxID=2755051 RepID=A0A839JV82_9FIRM|nr:glutamine--fructose-6-phosphate transaminase (isomerizing) [Variimorphobacter saccharofermentans]MBB2181306.1 glutamine--fructose-6-phosphate transaminase (isomerizing) [Variimorphobacter saccharofermentans]